MVPVATWKGEPTFMDWSFVLLTLNIPGMWTDYVFVAEYDDVHWHYYLSILSTKHDILPYDT